MLRRPYRAGVFLWADDRFSSGWVIRCHVGGGLSLFSQNGIFATIAVGFRGCNSSFYLFMGSLSGFCFSLQPLLFCISNHSLKISASDAFEVIQKRHRACLLNFWNIFRREIYNGVMVNWSVEIRHDYKGGIILQASKLSARAADAAKPLT